MLNFTNGQTSVSFTKCVASTLTLIQRCRTYSAANSDSVDTNALKCAECDPGNELIINLSSNWYINLVPNFKNYCNACKTDFSVLNFWGDEKNEIYTRCVESRYLKPA